MISIREIEQTLKETIEKSVLGSVIKTVGGYQEVAHVLSEEHEEIGLLPGIFIMYMGGPFARPANATHSHSPIFRIFIVTQSFTREIGRTAEEAGIYDLVDAVLLLLSENTIGLSELKQGFRPQQVEALAIDLEKMRGLNAYVIDFQTKYFIEARHEDFSKALEELNIVWYLQPEHPVGDIEEDFEATIDLTD